MCIQVDCLKLQPNLDSNFWIIQKYMEISADFKKLEITAFKKELFLPKFFYNLKLS